MTLLETIKQASITARKERDKMASFLVTLYSESAMVGKNDKNRETTDAEVIKVIKKFIKGLEEVIIVLEARGDQAVDALNKALAEKQILEGYLPKMLSTAELEALVDEALTTGADNIGKVIQFVKAKVDATTVDMSVVTQFIKDKLK
jgi:uncharacterized protein YqeY